MKLFYGLLFFLAFATTCIGQSNKISIDKAIWNVRFNEPYFHSYQSKQILRLHPAKGTFYDNLPEFNLLEVEPIFSKDSLRNFIYPIHKLIFNYGEGDVCVIKYKLVKDSIFSNSKIVKFQKKTKWGAAILSELENVDYAIQVLKIDSFWAFYNPEKTAFPAIDAIKAQFKDTEGILDIDKLGAYLKTKPSALKEYCDF